MSQVHYTNAQQRQISRVIPDLVRARELLLDLIIKDLRARYRYAVMGFLWAVVEPLALTVILTVVFTFFFESRLPGGQTANAVSYPVKVLAGLTLWQFFSQGLSRATRSILDNRSLVQKVYFAREVLPLSAIGGCFVNVMISLGILVGLHCALGGRPEATWLYVPVIIAFEVALVIGLSFVFASLNVRFHDVSYIVDVGLVFGFYVSPVFYFLEEHVQTAVSNPWLVRAYLANPVAGLITAFREAFLYGQVPDAGLLVWPAILAAAVLGIGVVVFRRNAGLMADNL